MTGTTLSSVIPSPPSAAPHSACDLPLGVTFRDRFPLVELPFAARQADLDLRTVAREVHAQRDQRVPLLPHFADEAGDLLAMKKQLAGAHRLVVHRVCLRVRR